MKTFAKISAVFLCLMLAAAAAAVAYYFAATAGTALQTDKLILARDGYAVYDINDDLIAEVAAEGAQKSVRVGDLPDHVKDAFICAEDKNFYSHRGLDYKGIARAVLANICARSFKQGGSTISQQLVKNTQLTNEKTVRRKLKEIRLTRQLEKKYTKAEILEMYLNTIYFGHACYGIESASAFYFGKEAEKLDVTEGATLAAIIRSPNNYSPFVDENSCLAARNNVLRRMRDLGKITAAEFDAAAKAPLPNQREGADPSTDYLSAMCRELETLPFWHPYKMLDGCRIYTYMQPEAQEYAEQLKTDADRSGKSILIADNAARGIIAWHSTEGELRRSPGSALKPFIYAAAIQENLLSPCTPLLDEQTNFGDYTPAGYRDQYKGWVSARTALAESLNIPAVKVLNELGTERAAHYLQKFGLRVEGADRTLALALGGMAEGYTARELAGAYAALSNGGEYAPLSFIRKIESADGEILYEHKVMPTRAIDENTASLTTDMLRCAAKEGTAKKLSALPFEIAAKTGTSGTDAGNTDAWAISSTTKHTIAVWMGNADNALTDITGGGLPCHYCMLLNKMLYSRSAPAPFSVPETVCKCDIDLSAYLDDHIVRLAFPEQPLKTKQTELFRKEAAPHEYSPIYSDPCDAATLNVKRDTISIELCHTKYYDYIIKRENDRKVVQIFDGSFDAVFTDPSPQGGKVRYRIIPYYIGQSGKPVYGKEIVTPYADCGSITPPIPNDWWLR